MATADALEREDRAAGRAVLSNGIKRVLRARRVKAAAQTHGRKHRVEDRGYDAAIAAQDGN